MQSHAPSPAAPVARSAALERRLRRRRQEARIRARLACDGVLLQSHHASQRPSAPAAPRTPFGLALDPLQRQVDALQATVAALGPRGDGPSSAAQFLGHRAEAAAPTVEVAFADAACQTLETDTVMAADVPVVDDLVGHEDGVIELGGHFALESDMGIEDRGGVDTAELARARQVLGWKTEFLQSLALGRGSPATQQFFFDELLQVAAQLAQLLAVQVPETDASYTAVRVGDTESLSQLESDVLNAARFTAWFPSYVAELRGRALWSCGWLGAAKDAVRSAVAELSARAGAPWSMLCLAEDHGWLPE